LTAVRDRRTFTLMNSFFFWSGIAFWLIVFGLAVMSAISSIGSAAHRRSRGARN